MVTDELGKNGHWPNWPRAEKCSEDGAPLNKIANWAHFTHLRPKF